MLPFLAGLLVAALAVLALQATWHQIRVRNLPRSTVLRFAKTIQVSVSLVALAACAPPTLQERVCAGQGSSSSPALEQAPHTITFVAVGDSTMIMVLGTDSLADDWNTQAPTGWRPATGEEPQVVACVEEQQDEISTCTYTGGSSLVRYQRQLTIELREARTADLLAERTFEGSAPRQCPNSKSADLRSITGDAVPLDTILPWLRQYVEPSQ